MAWFRCGGGGGGIPASLQTDMDAVFNKKFGTSTTYDSSVWADTVNIMGPLPSKSLSGTVVNIQDGADAVPFSAFSASWLALTGFSSISLTKAGKNLIEPPTLTASTDSLCLDLGKDLTFDSVTFSFLATASEVSITTSAIVDYRESDGTHHYVTLNGCRDSNNVQFTSSGPNNGVFKNTMSNVTFRYVYISYTTNSRSRFTSDSLSNWQIEVGDNVSAYEAYTSPTVTPISLGATVYGGTANLLAGTGTSTHAKVTFTGADTENWNYSESGGKYRVWINLPNGEKNTNTFISNLVTPAASVINYPDIGEGWINNSNNIVIGVDSSITSASDWKTYLSNNNLEIAYELADEHKTDLTFTPITAETPLGVSNWWNDAGDTALTYYRDINLALGGN